MEKKKLYKRPWFIILLIVVFILLILVSPVLYVLYGFWFVPEVLQWHKEIEYEKYKDDVAAIALYTQETFSDQALKALIIKRSEDGYLCFYDRKNDVYHTVPKEISGALVNITMGDPDIFHDGYVYAIVIRTDGSVIFSGDETCPLKLVYSPNGKPDFDVDVKIKKADENWYYVKQI